MKTDQTRVFFKYEKEEIQTENGAKMVKKPGGTITAVMKKVDSDEEIATREVKLRHGDKSDILTGRKYAFKKLMTHSLENELIPKTEVGILWKLFGSTCKQPEKKLAY